eukprot:jgi/Mesvir1/3844/Mv19810-RA.1
MPCPRILILPISSPSRLTPLQLLQAMVPLCRGRRQLALESRMSLLAEAHALGLVAMGCEPWPATTLAIVNPCFGMETFLYPCAGGNYQPWMAPPPYAPFMAVSMACLPPGNVTNLPPPMAPGDRHPYMLQDSHLFPPLEWAAPPAPSASPPRTATFQLHDGSSFGAFACSNLGPRGDLQASVSSILRQAAPSPKREAMAGPADSAALESSSARSPGFTLSKDADEYMPTKVATHRRCLSEGDPLTADGLVDGCSSAISSPVAAASSMPSWHKLSTSVDAPTFMSPFQLHPRPPSLLDLEPSDVADASKHVHVATACNNNSGNSLNDGTLLSGNSSSSAYGSVLTNSASVLSNTSAWSIGNAIPRARQVAAPSRMTATSSTGSDCEDEICSQWSLWASQGGWPLKLSPTCRQPEDEPGGRRHEQISAKASPTSHMQGKARSVAHEQSPAMKERPGIPINLPDDLFVMPDKTDVHFAGAAPCPAQAPAGPPAVHLTTAPGSPTRDLVPPGPGGGAIYQRKQQPEMSMKEPLPMCMSSHLDYPLLAGSMLRVGNDVAWGQAGGGHKYNMKGREGSPLRSARHPQSVVSDWSTVGVLNDHGIMGPNDREFMALLMSVASSAISSL